MAIWKIIGKSAQLKKGDTTSDGQIVQYVDPQGRVYVDANSTPVEKHAVEKRGSMFGNLINRDGIGEGVERVTKAADVCEYEFVPGIGLRRVDPDIILDSPKPTDGKRDPQNPASSFPRSSSIVDRPTDRPSDSSVRPMGPYAMVE